MPPDSETLRHRAGNVLPHNDDTDEDDSLALPLRSSMKDVKGHELVIDGLVYDISKFHDHPGGDQIQLFGGNDVSVHYRMIHPHHVGLQQLQKKLPIVGKMAQYHSDYVFDTDFERDMKRQVFQVVRRGQEYGTTGWFVRALAYLALFLGLQFMWVVSGPTVLLAVLYGVAQALVGMNVQHDANHGAASKQAWINDLLGLGADLIGGSKWLWQEQHWTHHVYTNHASKDPDSFTAEPLLLFNDYPKHDPRRRWYHSYQTLFYLPLLSLYWVSSVFTTEVLDLQHQSTQNITGERWISPHVQRSAKYATFWRLWYIALNCAVPLYFSTHYMRTMGLILLMGVVESLTLAVLFSLSHNFETAERDPTHIRTNDKKNHTTTTSTTTNTNKPVCWFRSQVETSCTYGGSWAGYLTGGLNYQIEHHLFPRMSSAWYPTIAPVVRKVCAKHNVHYQYYPTVFHNFVSTVQYLHHAGCGIPRIDVHRHNPLKGQM